MATFVGVPERAGDIPLPPHAEEVDVNSASPRKKSITKLLFIPQGIQKISIDHNLVNWQALANALYRGELTHVVIKNRLNQVGSREERFFMDKALRDLNGEKQLVLTDVRLDSGWHYKNVTLNNTGAIPHVPWVDKISATLTESEFMETYEKLLEQIGGFEFLKSFGPNEPKNSYTKEISLYLSKSGRIDIDDLEHFIEHFTALEKLTIYNWKKLPEDDEVDKRIQLVESGKMD